MWWLSSNQSPLPSPDPSSRQAPAFDSSRQASDNASRGSAAPRGGVAWPPRTACTAPPACVRKCIRWTVRGLAFHARHRPRARPPQQERPEPPRSHCFASCVPTCTHGSHRAGSPASLLISEAPPPAPLGGGSPGESPRQQAHLAELLDAPEDPHHALDLLLQAPGPVLHPA